LQEIVNGAREAVTLASSRGITVGTKQTPSQTLAIAAATVAKMAESSSSSPKAAPETEETEKADSDQQYQDALQELELQRCGGVDKAACDAACKAEAPPSMLEDKATKSSEKAKLMNQDYMNTVKEAETLSKNAQAMRQKADCAKTVAIEAYQRAGLEAVETAKAKVASSQALKVCDSQLSAVNVDASAQKAKLDATAKVAKQKAALAEAASDVKLNAVMDAKCKSEAKTKADCDAALSYQASLRIAAKAQSFMADLNPGAPCPT
jgi:hypothetical protein